MHRDENRLVILIQQLVLHSYGVTFLTDAFDQIGLDLGPTCLLLFLSRGMQLEAQTPRHEYRGHCMVPDMRFDTVICKDDCKVSASCFVSPCGETACSLVSQMKEVCENGR